jgi:2-oxoglutarate dehydrogenase E2 component (dihydrolipoamide succinyltransferase)
MRKNMATDIIVPQLGESVTEATVAKWLKSVGDRVEVDDPIVELETDKVTLEVNATVAGVISEIAADSGAEVSVGAVLGSIGAGGAGAEPAAKSAADIKAVAAPAAETAPASVTEAEVLSPSVRKLVDEHKLDPAQIPRTGKNGRLTKGDVLAWRDSVATGTPAAATPVTPVATPTTVTAGPREDDPREERVRMTRLRKRIAERLKEAQNTAAMLSTFNEVDMTEILALRAKYRESFEKKHGVRLGFMSIFAKACVVALKEIPAVNGEIDGDDIVYKNHYDIGIAVGTPQGLVVPVIRDADKLSFSEIEKTLAALAVNARDGKLSMDELTGGTFTITNGGVYGSLLSTPILNTPQSGILGMHKTQPRPIAVGDKVEIRPMMYLALSYDHRIIDGREAVTFLVRVKECLENPERILIDA